jgi:hypothetical protein
MKAQVKWLENTEKKGTGYFFLKKLPVPFFMGAVPIFSLFFRDMKRCQKPARPLIML